MTRKTADAVLFQDALPVAEKSLRNCPFAGEVTLVRDLRGRIRLLFSGSREDFDDEQRSSLERLCRELSHDLGAYGFAPESMALFASDLCLDMDRLNADRRRVNGEGNETFFLLDRQIVGQDWLAPPFDRPPSPARAAFFSVKGGVGRSTAVAVWAWWLAGRGKRVLVLDLDLESPGLSSTLLPRDSMPEFGVVDWFVEEGVGQEWTVTTDMVAVSPLAQGLPGYISVVPAFGYGTNDYVSKLARCYAQGGDDEPREWSRRLESMVEFFEEQESPDLVLLDSRAGIHDIAAAAVTRMGAQSFLFAVDTAQTWSAYEALFRHWRRYQSGHTLDLRKNLQMVSAMVPETDGEPYLRRFRERSWDLFRENLYDDVSADGADVAEAPFSFDLEDRDGPHFPLPIYWHRGFQAFDPLRSVEGLDEKIARDAMEQCMVGMERLMFDGEGDV